MIQDIKTAVLAGIQSLMVPGQLCDGLTATSDSEVDIQPSGNSPIFQLKLINEEPPDELKGFGSPVHFGTAINLLAQLKTTAAEPQASRDLYRLWYTRTNGNLQGVRIALNQLVSTGLQLASGDAFMVEMSEMRRGISAGSYTCALECRLTFRTIFNG